MAQCGGCGAGRELVCRACDGVHDVDGALHESKCMVEHEGFHLAVDPAAPEGPLEERPSNLDLGFRARDLYVASRLDFPGHEEIGRKINQEQSTGVAKQA